MNDILLILLAVALVLNFWYLLFKLINSTLNIDWSKVHIFPPVSKFGLEKVTYVIGGFGLLLLTFHNWLPEWLTGLAPEFIGISVTILIIDRLVEERNKRAEKQRLIRQMGSPVNDFALEAIRFLRELGAIEDGSLTQVNLVLANLRGADLHRVNLMNSNLQEANLMGAYLPGSNLEGASLREANLEGANLMGVNLKGADFRRAHLKGINLGAANLEGTGLRQANLEGAILVVANLQRADLRQTNLSKAHLGESNLAGAIYNAKTKWPDEFDPERAGAIQRGLPVSDSS